MQEQMKSIDSQKQLEMRFAIACDLDLEYYLMPKEWISEIVTQVVLMYVW